MSSSLILTPLLEVYPDFYNTPKKTHKFKENTPPPYSSSIYQNEDEVLDPDLSKIKDFQKLRIINDKLFIDNRYFKFIRRRLSKDNRWAVINHLKTYAVKDKKHHKKLNYILDVLCRSTYKNDKDWLAEAYLLRTQLK